ncbi:pro-corazonin [Macrobrachium rosenbergii]|uniref:pro-corazonin n=1 Tax=Macrobrachium rosenbergii TaxID=79674 RepID=UPI0034D5E899
MVRLLNQQQLLAAVFLVTITIAAAQTFQYSRGWTNGRKRSDPTIGQRKGVDNMIQTLPVSRLLAEGAPHQHGGSARTVQKTIEDRLRNLEVELNTLLTASNSALPPPGNENEYYPEK